MSTIAMNEGWFENGGLKLHYMQWGRDDMPPVLMLHGLRSYAMTWEPVAHELAKRYRVIALDQRGRGDSDWDPTGNYSTDAYVSDLAALADHLVLSRFILVGHSMGGTNALVYTARHPERVRALVIEDIGPGSSSASDGAARIISELHNTPAVFATWDAARSFWRSNRPKVSASALDSRVRYSMRQREDGAVVWKYDAEGIARARIAMTTDPAKAVDLWPCVHALRCPSLLIRGAESDFLPIETAQAMTSSNAMLSHCDVPGASHYVHDDNLDGFMVALKAFLSDLSADVMRK